MLTILKTFVKMNKLQPISPRNILNLTKDEKRKFLNSFDHVFSDIDGVVWNLSHVNNGVADGFKELQKVNKKITFITNNSVRPEEMCIENLKAVDIEIDADNLWHPSKSIVNYLKSIKFEGLIYIIASEHFKETLRKEGFKLLDGPNEVLEESLHVLLAKGVVSEPVKAVIIDFDINLSYVKMLRANLYLQKSDCLLLGGATDFQMPVTKDLSLLGPGPFVKMLEQTSRQKMLTFGKPGKPLADVLTKHFNIKKANRALMIGDMLDQDIRFATLCGFQSLLVLTGGCTLAELMAQTDPNVIPTYYANSVFDFVEFMNDLNK